jgi:hypothetical protein
MLSAGWDADETYWLVGILETTGPPRPDLARLA